LVELTADRARLAEMARAARAARNIDAASRLADLCVAAGSAVA
jgi:UDP-N-acetylglucosamine:LPS N-acetylglucosamine transferase